MWLPFMTKYWTSETWQWLTLPWTFKFSHKGPSPLRYIGNFRCYNSKLWWWLLASCIDRCRSIVSKEISKTINITNHRHIHTHILLLHRQLLINTNHQWKFPAWPSCHFQFFPCQWWIHKVKLLLVRQNHTCNQHSPDKRSRGRGIRDARNCQTKKKRYNN